MNYLFSLGLTLLLELTLALLWKIPRRDLSLVALVNLLTNPLVVLSHGLLAGHSALLHTVLPEFGAVAAEATIYRCMDNRIRRPILFAIAANLFSFTAGMLLRRLVA